MFIRVSLEGFGFRLLVHRPTRSLRCFGGDEEDRTPDPLRARQVLSQLSYTPTVFDRDFESVKESPFLPSFASENGCHAENIPPGCFPGA